MGDDVILCRTFCHTFTLMSSNYFSFFGADNDQYNTEKLHNALFFILVSVFYRIQYDFLLNHNYSFVNYFTSLLFVGLTLNLLSSSDPRPVSVCNAFNNTVIEYCKANTNTSIS